MRALAADRPVVLELKNDPEVAPLPPHVTLVLAKAFMFPMANGDPGVSQVIADTARQLVEGVTERLDPISAIWRRSLALR